jgi:hypothetical protein
MLQGKKRAEIDNTSPVSAGPSYRGPLSKRKKCRARHFFSFRDFLNGIRGSQHDPQSISSFMQRTVD